MVILLRQNHCNLLIVLGKDVNLSQYIKTSLTCCLLVSTCWCTPIWAWNMLGHKVIANIAYDNLTDSARKKIKQILQVDLPDQSGRTAMAQASAWPDQIKKQHITTFNTWHWINLPYDTRKNSYTNRRNSEFYQRLNAYNVVWAIMQAQLILKQVDVDPALQKLFLMFLMHFVGDIHQPLHCITRYSRAFPKGDQGGNLFIIKSDITDNLHALWDKGLGSLQVAHAVNGRAPYDRDKTIAQTLEKKYSKSLFLNQLQVTDPMQWARESYDIAKTFAYETPYGKAPSPAYYQKGRQIVNKQLVLAGYRLAAVLNILYS